MKTNVYESVYESVNKALHVEGILWSGAKSKHAYPLHVIGRPDLEGVEPANISEAKRIAGDFSELTKVKIVTTKREVKETITTKRL